MSAHRTREPLSPQTATRRAVDEARWHDTGSGIVHRAGALATTARAHPRRGAGIDTGIVGTSPSLAAGREATMHLALRRGGLASSTDGGRTWVRRCPPDLPNGSSHDAGEHGYTWSDPTTGRLFYVTFGGLTAPRRRGRGRWSSGSLLSWSGDDGHTWVTQEIATDTWDWPKVLAGAPRSGPVEGEHPSVMYFFGTHPFLLGPLRKVYRSRDGGSTWQATANVAGDALEPGYGTVAPDGTIYIDEPYFLGALGQLHGSPYPYRWRDQGRLRLLISRDEGDTWEHRVIPDAHAPSPSTASSASPSTRTASSTSPGTTGATTCPTCRTPATVDAPGHPAS